MSKRANLVAVFWADSVSAPTQLPGLGGPTSAAYFLNDAGEAVGEEGDGTIEVYDTAENLLTSTSDIPLNISIELPEFPFTHFSFVADELGAPDGIGKVIYINAPSPQAQTGGLLVKISIDDFGFTTPSQQTGGDDDEDDDEEEKEDDDEDDN